MRAQKRQEKEGGKKQREQEQEEERKSFQRCVRKEVAPGHRVHMHKMQESGSGAQDAMNSGYVMLVFLSNMLRTCYLLMKKNVVNKISLALFESMNSPHNCGLFFVLLTNLLTFTFPSDPRLTLVSS